MSEITQDIIDRVASAIDSAETGHSMSLVRLVEGVSTYRLKIEGTVVEFTDTDEDQAIDQAYTRIRQVKQRKQAEAVISALSEWQDISTVPTDGTVIDLWHEEFGRHADHYWGKAQHTCGEAGEYCDSEWHDTPEGWVDSSFNQSTFLDGFTHWMPLPAPPTPSKARQTEEARS